MREAERVSIVKHGLIKYFIPTAAQLGMRSLYSRKGRKAPVRSRNRTDERQPRTPLSTN